MANKKAFLLLIFLVSLPAWGKRQKKIYTPSLVTFGFDAQYWGTSFKNYFWTSEAQVDHKSQGISLSTEWFVMNNQEGKVSLGVSSGFSVASNVLLSEEIQASLVTIPLGVFASYRAHLSEKQFIIPYVKAGYEWLINTQTSQTGGEREGWRRYQSVIAGGGLQLSLNTLDVEQGHKLDTLTGINEVYLTIEYFLSRGFFGEQIVNLDHQEFRLGLRIEG